MAIPWLNSTTFELASTFVMKGVDKVPDQWFDKIPVIGKFYHAPGESKGNAKSSTGDSRYSKDERRTRNKRSQHRRRSHGDMETRYNDQIYSPDGSKRRSRSGHKSPGSQRRSDRPFTDNMEGIGMPRAYNPADYVSTPSGTDPFPPAQKDNGMVPDMQIPLRGPPACGTPAGAYVPYSEFYSHRGGGSSDPMSPPMATRPFSPQPSFNASQSHPRTMPQSYQQMMQQGSGLMQQQATSMYGLDAGLDTQQNRMPEMRSAYEDHFSPGEDSDSASYRSRRARRSSKGSPRSNREPSHSRRARADSLVGLGLGHAGRDKRKTAALASGTAIGGIVGNKMGGIPGALVGLASGYGLARSMTKAREQPEY